MAMNPLISKTRKPKFDLTLKIIDLNNVPLVTGTSFTKWHLPSSTSAEHRGRTSKSPIIEHKVSWDYVKTIPLRLTIDKANNLQECIIHFEILQDFHNIGTKIERVTLGTLSLNLAEYVEESEMQAGGAEGDEGVVRRYLMGESKINSTLKVGICMKQIDGERNYVAPPLKTAAVFGGIAGIMAGEQGDKDKLHTDTPIISKSRDAGDLQDMYRLALAASWGAQMNELSADQCIEDIFNGGDGWKDTYSPIHTSHSNPSSHLVPHMPTHIHDHSDDEHHHGRRVHHRSHSGTSLKSQNTITKKTSFQRMRGHKHTGSQETVFGRQVDGAGEGSEDGSQRDGGVIGGMKRSPKEVDEFDVRDDLVAWRLPVA